MKYAYRNGENWLYRRKFPQDVRHLFPTEVHKVSLKTRDKDVAKARVNSENQNFERMVASARSGSPDLDRLEELLQQNFDAMLRGVDHPEMTSDKAYNTSEYFDGEAQRSYETGEYGWPDGYHEEVLSKLSLPETPEVRMTVVKAIALMRLHCARAMVARVNHEPLPERLVVFVEGASPVRGARVEDLISGYQAARHVGLSTASRKSLDYAMRLFGSPNRASCRRSPRWRHSPSAWSEMPSREIPGRWLSFCGR